jgi:septal ring factor EnvC (AmiA/AmiB activator)
MAAKDDDGIASAVSSVHALWEDDEVRARIQAREDYYRQRRWELEQLAEAEKKIAEANKQLAEAEKKSAEAEKELVVEKKKNQELQAEIDRLRQLLAEK